MEQPTAAPLAHQIPAACHRLGIGRSSLYELIRAGQLQTIRIAGRTLIPETELQRLVAEAVQGKEVAA